jgi:hypothetical protein
MKRLLIGSFAIAMALTGAANLPKAMADDASIGKPAKPAHAMLRTEDFESGTVQFSDCDAHQLEAFLRDLNRRKDFDFQTHGGQAGPNSDFLANWVTRVTNELSSRGYFIDENGQLCEPSGAAVVVR